MCDESARGVGAVSGRGKEEVGEGGRMGLVE